MSSAASAAGQRGPPTLPSGAAPARDRPAPSGVPDARQKRALDVRGLLIQELQDDIVGPRGGPEEELPSSESPLRGYMSGILFPRHLQANEEDNEGRSGVQAGSGAADGGGDADAGADPAAGAAGAGGVPSTGANPSSFGLSCTLAPGTDLVRARIEYGTYSEEASEESRARKFRRMPHSETIDIPAARPGSASVPLQDRPEFEVRYSIKAGSQGGPTALRVFVVNTNVHLGAAPPGVSRCVFQPRITLLPPDGAAGEKVRIFVGSSGSGGSASAPADDPGDPDMALFEMMFREKVHVAIGHCCAVRWDEKEAAEHGAVSSLETTFVPRYDVPHVGPRRSDAAYLDMRALYEAGAADYAALLSPLADEYEAWISGELEPRAARLPARHKGAAERQAAECRMALRRIRRGIEIVSTDAAAADAFSFANRAMHLQMSHARWIRDKRAGVPAPAYEPGPCECRWHMFQLAFFLLNIESITDPSSEDRAAADLLWFPTGGGKTEAYLGLIAFTLAHRRVRGRGGANHLRYGTAVIMRYTLRLLTLQQFHRAAALMCACEFVRRRAPDKWGDEPFLVGLWVGSGATPNRLESAREAIDEARAGRPRRGENPVQIIACPWCGEEITARDYRVSGRPEQCRVYCPSRYCEFSDRPGAGETNLPVLVVDDDIYRRCPSMVIGTVDKFAQLTWKWRAGAVLGRVDKYCQKHGFTVDALDGDCGAHDGAASFLLGDHGPARLDPPELIIQDELHLISGPLGTLTGIYETAIDALCAGGSAGRPKIIASTATAKKAPGQIAAVFDRRDSRVFPPQGLDYGESFFATRADPDETPGRAYVGMCITSRSGPTVLGRLSAAVLRKVRALEEASEFAPADLDPYHTLVSYFNTLRDLGGANKMYDDTVPRLIQRIHANFEGGAGGAGGGKKQGDGRTYRDALLEKKELTSRIDSSDIPDILSGLEVAVDGAGPPKDRGSAAGRAPAPVDVLLCTNMLSVGVDIPRLGVMIVNGQPKNHSEYIQATGRIGRASPGLVIANLNYLKPRDLSHYEDFAHYHATLHKNVEPNTVTPFSSRSRDRALLAVLVAMLRHEDTRLAADTGAAEFRASPPESHTARILDRARAAILARARSVDPGQEEGTSEDIDRLAGVWHEAATGGLPLRYSRPWHRLARQMENTEYLMRPTGEDASRGLEEVPNSLRDAEPPVPVWYLEDMRGGGGT